MARQSDFEQSTARWDERLQIRYWVTDVKTVTPDEVSVLDQTLDPTATLITCVPAAIYSHRLVVTARLV